MYGEHATTTRKLAQERAKEAFEAEKVAKENEKLLSFLLLFGQFQYNTCLNDDCLIKRYSLLTMGIFLSDKPFDG